MRALIVIILALCAPAGCLYGTVDDGKPAISCSSNDECPMNMRCGSIVEAGACTVSGFGLPPDEYLGDEIPDQDSYWFHCEAERRFYPFCVSDTQPLRCGPTSCPSQGNTCVLLRDLPGDPPVCRTDDEIFGDCSSCGAGRICALAFRFGDDEIEQVETCVPE